MEIADFKIKLQHQLEFLKGELAKIRSGRVSPALVEDITVDYYGAKTPIKSLASTSTVDARTIVIEPWDKNAIDIIAKALTQASLGGQTVVDGAVIRMSMPALTQERRKELIKLVSQIIEETKIKSRQVREDIIKMLQLKEKEGRMSEDEKFRKKEEIEKVMKEHVEKLEEMRGRKEKELMS